jgi:hypothetical protein
MILWIFSYTTIMLLYDDTPCVIIIKKSEVW